MSITTWMGTVGLRPAALGLSLLAVAGGHAAYEASAKTVAISVDGQVRDYDDVFGNRVRRVLIERPFTELTIDARSRVELLDIDPLHYTLDPAELARVLADPPAGLPPIRAVIAVHLYGQAADLDAILPLCRKYGVALIEDCAQAHGATLHGKRLGTIGDIGAFSLYPTKNLGALGDGGVLATNDMALAERIAALRQYGWRTHYVSDAVGVNSRLDEIQAAILRVRLKRLDAGNARRGAIAAAYDLALVGIAPPARRPGASHVFHQYVVRVAGRPEVQARLRAAGIATGIHYAMPVHRQPAYEGRTRLGPSGCRESEAAADQVLSLPMYPELSDAQVASVCSELRAL